MKRRDFLKSGLQSAALMTYLVNLPLANAQSSQTKLKLNSLPSFLDTLIPEDSTPSASQLGLEQKLITHADKIKDYVALLELGCQWLDFQARAMRKVDFKLLSADMRQRIVTMAETSPRNSIPRQFFDHVRNDLFKFYYSEPSIWPSLGIYGAPQPYGYPDYIRPPKSRKS